MSLPHPHQWPTSLSRHLNVWFSRAMETKWSFSSSACRGEQSQSTQKGDPSARGDQGARALDVPRNHKPSSDCKVLGWPA